MQDVESNKCLIIGKPTIETVAGGGKRLYVDLTVSTESYTVWYEVAREYGDYLCYERADGILVNVLLYAMEHQYDIRCEVPVSETLFYSLTTDLLPAIAKNIEKYHLIKIDAEISAEPLTCKNAVGASISGGVDSFYTLFKHRDRKEKNYNITHLCFFNAGASGARGGDWARERYLNRIKWIEEVCKQMNLALVCVDTNINEFLLQDHESTHTFRTLAIPLILQKLFSKYYFSSGYEYKNFSFDTNDTAAYDLLITQCISTEELKFVLNGAEATRLEKVRFIADEPLVQKKLNVCTAEVSNCSRCDKCMRTMLELEAVGKLELFKGNFDVDYFHKHKRQYYMTMCALRKWKQCTAKADWEEVYQSLKKELTPIDYFGGIFVRWYRMLRRVVYRTSYGKRLYEKLNNKK